MHQRIIRLSSVIAHLHYPRGHRLEQDHRQPFKVGDQKDRLAGLQQRLVFVGGRTPMEVDAVGECGLIDELLAGGAIGAVADQLGFDLAENASDVDEGVHHLLDALLALHHAAANHHAEPLIREADQGR